MSKTPPSFEYLQDALGAFKDGHLAEDGVLQVLEQVANHLVDYMEEFEDLEEPVPAAIHQAFQDHLAALEELAENLESPAESLQKVQTALEKLVAFQESPETPGTVPCVFCGHPNPSSSLRCGSCTAKLPLSSDHREDNTLSLGENDVDSETLTLDFVTLAGALEQWNKKVLSEEGLRDVCGRVGRNFEQQMKEMAEFPAQLSRLPKALAERGKDISEQSLRALEMSQLALQELLSHLESEPYFRQTALATLQAEARELVKCQEMLTELAQSLQKQK